MYQNIDFQILQNDTLLNIDKDDEKFGLANESNAQKNGKMCSC